MHKKDELKIWLFGLMIGLVMIVLDFGTAGQKISQYIPQVDRILNSRIFNSIEDMRRAEDYFWANIKGVGELDEGKNDDDVITPTEAPANTPIPGVTTTPTVVPTPADYTGAGVVVPPFSVQLIGDSMMLEGFGPQMKSKLLGYQGVTVYVNGKYSTGLNRIDYFDWYKRTSELLAQNKPDVIVIMYGANDGQDIVALDGSIGRLGTDKWKTIYRQRVTDYLTLVSPKVGLVYWVGHPIPRTDDFYGKFSTMNPIYQEECAKIANCRYVDMWSRFAVDGKYSPTLADDNGLVQTVKGSDGVHVTVHGGNIMADEVIEMMLKDIEMEKK